jgi:hypothetical protein
MTKGIEIYEGLKIRNWIKTQDFATKYGKLSKKRQALYEALAIELGSSKANEPSLSPVAQLLLDVQGSPAPAKKKKEGDKKQKKITAYTLFKKKLAGHRRDNNEPKLTAAEVRTRFKELEPNRVQRWVQAAAKLNECT